VALHFPDFRAAERTFQLVTQVAGRTGRGPRGGRVLVQTFSPEHPAIMAACRHDYSRFAQGELPQREALCYPPYAEMVRLLIRGPGAQAVEEQARAAAVRLQAALGAEAVAARLLGPAPAPIRKLRGEYRFQIQVQAADGAALRRAVQEALTGLPLGEGLYLGVDVDPLDML
jgi:primosomal protein N' (replication factor Y)